MKILVSRIAWMKTYRNRGEEVYSEQKYIKDREGYPFESLNFKKLDGRYYGYVPHKGKVEVDLDISKLGADKLDDKIEGILVVFCARSRDTGKQFVVGWYENATVYREAQESKWSEDGPRFRFSSEKAFLVKESKREFVIPTGQKNSMGRANIWYGVNLDNLKKFREELLAYIRQERLTRKINSLTIIERKRLKRSRSIERQGNHRRFIHEKGFTCEACGWSIGIHEQDVWGASFELHHLNPFSDLEEGESRKLGIDDFAVLCASCHKAIHRTEYVSDIETFKKKYCIST